MTCILDISGFDEAFFSVIKDTEIKIAKVGKDVKSKKLSVCGRVLLGYMLNKNYGIDSFSFRYGVKGKPYLENEDIFFNISHSGSFVLCSADRCEIGCDVQKIQQYNPAVAKRFFTEKEVSVIGGSDNQSRAFIKLWALKESVLKKTGEGVGGGLKDYDFSDCLNLDSFEAYGYRFSCFRVKDYEIAVCSESEKQRLEVVTKEEIQKYIDRIKN